MPVLNSGVRIGAAAVVVGLSLAGPQALGVASADTAAADSKSVSAEPAEPGAVSGDEGSPARSAAGRGGRGVKPFESTVSRVGPRASADATSARQTPVVEAVRRSVRGSVSARPVAAVADRRKSVAVTPSGFGAPVLSVPSVPDVVSGVPEVAVAVPSAAAVVADAARVPGRAERGAAVRVAVQPATPPVMQALNTAITNLFDSTATWLSDLPASPARDLISGALLLVRRTLFNQLPTARPCGCGPLETSSGQYVGTVGAVDPEDGALIYSLAEAPQYGTVQITADGVYTYTPGEDFAGIDKFTVAVTDPGFNLLQPFSSRQLLVPVDVPGAGGCSAERSSAARCTREKLFTFHTSFEEPRRDGSFLGRGANGVYVRDGIIYAASESGVEISTDGGASWKRFLRFHATGVYVDESGIIYVATRSNGLVISYPPRAGEAPGFDRGFLNPRSSKGLGSDFTRGVYATGGKIYAATFDGLSISTDGGETFNNRLGGGVNGVYVRDGIIYAATVSGLAISTDGGTTWNYRTDAGVNATYVDESGIIYAGTGNGLSISTDGGATFTKRLYDDGCVRRGYGCQGVRGVYATGGKIYAATDYGLAISTDGGATFTEYGKAEYGTDQGGNGLSSYTVSGVYVDPAGIVYAALPRSYGGWGGVNISTRSLP